MIETAEGFAERFSGAFKASHTWADGLRVLAELVAGRDAAIRAEYSTVAMAEADAEFTRDSRQRRIDETARGIFVRNMERGPAYAYTEARRLEQERQYGIEMEPKP